MNKKEVNLFTYINQILYKNRKIPYDKKIANKWILSQWFSMDNNLIKYSNDINKYLSVFPDEAVYEYFMYVIPKGKRYIKYIKKKKEDESTKKIINKLKEEDRNLSTKECKNIIQSLKIVKRRNR